MESQAQRGQRSFLAFLARPAIRADENFGDFLPKTSSSNWDSKYILQIG